MRLGWWPLWLQPCCTAVVFVPGWACPIVDAITRRAGWCVRGGEHLHRQASGIDTKGGLLAAVDWPRLAGSFRPLSRAVQVTRQQSLPESQLHPARVQAELS